MTTSMQFCLHELPVQSLLAEQVLPLAHGEQTEPPQSTSVSVPSFWPSPHVVH